MSAILHSSYMFINGVETRNKFNNLDAQNMDPTMVKLKGRSEEKLLKLYRGDENSSLLSFTALGLLQRDNGYELLPQNKDHHHALIAMQLQLCAATTTFVPPNWTIGISFSKKGTTLTDPSPFGLQPWSLQHLQSRTPTVFHRNAIVIWFHKVLFFQILEYPVQRKLFRAKRWMGLAQADALGLIMDDNGTLWLAGRRTRASQNIRGKNSIEGKVGDEWRKESRELKRKWKVWLYDGQIGWNYRPIACATDVPTSLFEARGGMRSARQKPERTCARVRCRSSDQKKVGRSIFLAQYPAYSSHSSAFQNDKT